MNRPTEIKYPLDENGEPYFAATHVQAVQGLEEFDNGDGVENLQQIIRSLNITISTLQSRVLTLETDNEQMKQDIEILKVSIIPPEEGE